jgi:hypothetical protein
MPDKRSLFGFAAAVDFSFLPFQENSNSVAGYDCRFGCLDFLWWRKRRRGPGGAASSSAQEDFWTTSESALT